MAKTYTQLLVQIVFAVKGRQNFVAEKFRDNLEKYICGIITRNKSKPLAIYCNPDHVHIFIGLDPSISISDLVRDIKASSSKWINDGKYLRNKFCWQEGYGAFSYSKSQVDAVTKYILNQPIHHSRTRFKDEYSSILKKSDKEYDERYLFEWYD